MPTLGLIYKLGLRGLHKVDELISRGNLAQMIDSTAVDPFTTKEDVVKLCQDAVRYGFHGVCVNSTYVPLVVQLLKNAAVNVCSTVGFPYGCALPEVKALEAKRAVELGAHELDVVMNLSALKSKDYELVRKDLKGVIDVKREWPYVIIKVIIEAERLSLEEKLIACQLVKEAGADFVKTSTGILGRATVEDVKLLRATVGPNIGVKAAGGIRTYRDAIAMIEAGASRIGTSSAVAIVEGTPL